MTRSGPLLALSYRLPYNKNGAALTFPSHKLAEHLTYST